MDNEIWKDVKGYEGLYQVSNLGRVRSLGRVCHSKNNSMQTKRVRILTQEVTIWGYCRTRLYNENGKPKHHAVHRLVYEAFVGECGDYQINHINEIKTDNRVANLELMTAKENCNHGTRNARLSKINKAQSDKWVIGVEQLDMSGNVLNKYSSRLEAETVTGINNASISACCSGKHKTAGGYRWRNAG